MIDALRLSNPDERIEIFCLGTCPRPAGEYVDETELHRSFKEWRFGADVVTLALDAQEHVVDKMAQMLANHVNRGCRIVRFPHGGPSEALMADLDLDETSDVAMDKLVSQARTDAYATWSLLKRPDEDITLLNSMLCSIPGSDGACGNDRPLGIQ